MEVKDLKEFMEYKGGEITVDATQEKVASNTTVEVILTDS